MSSIAVLRQAVKPVITIQKNDGLLYTWNDFLGTRDFVLQHVTFKPPYLQASGSFTIKLFDVGSAIVNNVKRGNEVAFWIGKTDASKVKVMLGTVTNMRYETLSTGEGYVYIEGDDWGSFLLKNRVIYYSWHQLLQSDGTPDPTDTDTEIQKIISDIISNETVYPSTIKLSDAGLIYDVNQIDANLRTIKIPELSANFQIIDDILRTIDNIAMSATHGATPDKVFFLKRPNADSSGIMLVDNPFDSEAVTYGLANPGKVGAIRSDEPSTLAKSAEDYKRRLFGIGAGVDTKESSIIDTTTFDDLSQYRAVKLLDDTGTQSVVNRTAAFIGVYLSRNGTVAEDVVLELVEDFNGKPSGDSIRTIKLDKLALVTTPKVHYFDLGQEELNTAKSYWILLRKNGTNQVRWHHPTASVTSVYTRATSSNGTTWTITGPATASSYGYTFEYWYNRQIQNVAGDSGNLWLNQNYFYPEDVIRSPEITNSELMQANFANLQEIVFKEKWSFKCQIYPPDVMMQNGQTVRIKVTKSPVINHDASDWIITDLEYIFDAAEKMQTGNFSIDATFVRMVTPE